VAASWPHRGRRRRRYPGHRHHAAMSLIRSSIPPSKARSLHDLSAPMCRALIRYATQDIPTKLAGDLDPGAGIARSTLNGLIDHGLVGIRPGRRCDTWAPASSTPPTRATGGSSRPTTTPRRAPARWISTRPRKGSTRCSSASESYSCRSGSRTPTVPRRAPCGRPPVRRTCDERKAPPISVAAAPIRA
jgi:hypothetical protein